MRWYKFAIVLAAGLLLEVSIAAISCFLIQANGMWVKSLALPYFAPRSAVFYGVLMEIVYLCSALSLGFFTETKSDFPKGFLRPALLFLRTDLRDRLLFSRDDHDAFILLRHRRFSEKERPRRAFSSSRFSDQRVFLGGDLLRVDDKFHISRAAASLKSAKRL